MQTFIFFTVVLIKQVEIPLKMKEQMVFGIGLAKTGTTSLSQALKILGYNSKHYPFYMLSLDKGTLMLNKRNIDGLDALVDTPIPMFYEELDRSYPHSKFILTTRDMKSWLDSAKHHFTKKRAMIRAPLMGSALYHYLNQMYGSQTFDDDVFEAAYHAHTERVKRYFSGRENDLLIFNMRTGDGWQDLCSFLGEPVPEIEFPLENSRSQFRNIFPYDTVITRARQLLYRAV